MKTKLLLATLLVSMCFESAMAARASKNPAPRVRTTFDSDAQVSAYLPRHSNDSQSIKFKGTPMVFARPGIRADITYRIPNTGFAVGALGEYMALNEDNKRFSVAGGGVTGSYYFKGTPFTDSFYISPSAVYRSGRIEITNINTYGYSYWAGNLNGSADFDLYSAEALVGYQWHWDNFNLSVGAGPAYHTLTIKNVNGYFQGGVFGSGNFSTTQTSTSSFGAAVIELALGWSI